MSIISDAVNRRKAIWRRRGLARRGKRFRIVVEKMRVRSELRRLAKKGGPIVVGPFLGEVGFELLYWIPLLRWATGAAPELDGRLVVVSRGGTESWLEGLGARYADAFSFFPPDELQQRRGQLKQREASLLDEEIVKGVRERLGLEGGSVLHPGLIYDLYYRVVKLDPKRFSRSVRVEDGECRGFLASYRPIPAPEHPIRESLPDEYVAVRFYDRPSFPDTPENRRFAAEVVDALSRELPVVLLDPELALDDHHRDLPGLGNGDVIRLGGAMRPEDNLAVQTAAIAGSRGFVGTYGGLAYLAPFLGRPALAFASVPDEPKSWHLALALRIFEHSGFGRLEVLQPGDVDPERILTALDRPAKRAPQAARLR